MAEGRDEDASEEKYRRVSVACVLETWGRGVRKNVGARSSRVGPKVMNKIEGSSTISWLLNSSREPGLLEVWLGSKTTASGQAVSDQTKDYCCLLYADATTAGEPPGLPYKGQASILRSQHLCTSTQGECPGTDRMDRNITAIV